MGRAWWFTNHRLEEPLGYLPPAECEAQYLKRQVTPGAA